QVRSVVRFLDKDFSGTVDVRELDNAIRNFRALRRECPSLGAGPLTVLDPSDLDRLATYSFAQMLQRRQEQQRCQAKNSACQSHSGTGGSSGDTTTKPAADTVVSGSGIATVSVSEIAAAFKKAAREFEAQRQRGRQQGSDQASQSTSSTGNNYPHPSTDTKQAKEHVDKIMEWLRSSRTFDRAPTGRIPTLAEKMTVRQRMELELQNKLQ
ncbi:unnamed protein product, partial [Sphacelaria rigidula]